MMYNIYKMKNLYRRYRPLELADVVGQKQVVEPLMNSLKAGKVGHAYLFIGPRGTGKTSVARIFAHEVNNFKYELEDDYVDIIEIDGASNRGIDNIRELREKAAIAPTKGKYKIYIIDEVHMLTKEAFNALLKTLEEPPAHVIFIMATTDAHRVPVTITSRAQTYTFKLANNKVMFDYLRKVADQEKIKISDEALKIIVKRGGGSFRDSLSLLDQISTMSDKEITKELVVSVMGLPEDEKIVTLLSEYTEGNLPSITATLKDLMQSGVKPETLAEEIIELIINDPRPELLPLLAKLPEVKDPYAEAKLLVALVPEQLNSKTVTVPSHPVITTAVSDTPQKEPIFRDFNWQNFSQKVQKANEVVYKQLTKSEYDIQANTLRIYPKTKIIKNILEKPNNKRILDSLAEEFKVEICEAGTHPNSAAKDATLDKISDIMGGEVVNDNGGNDPF